MSQSPLRWGYLPLADSIATLLCCKAMQAAGQPWELIKFANNHLLLEAFRHGELDGGVSSAIFLPELEGAKGLAKIWGAASREGVTVFASPAGKFQDLSHLRGAVVSLPAKLTVHGALLYEVLQKQGLAWGQAVTIKYLPPAEGFKALGAGEVDLVLALEPLASRMEAEGNFSAVGHSRELWPRHLSFISIISPQSLTQNPNLETQWRQGYDQALARLASDYPRVAQAMAPLLGGEAPSLLQVLQPALPKIRYDEVAINQKEKEEWQRRVAALKGLV